MKVEGLEVGIMPTNCYLAYDEDSREALIIDPGDDADRIAGMIEKLDIRPAAIILTHAHFDHIYGVDSLKNKYSIPVLMQENEVNLAADPELNVSRRVRRPVAVNADRALKDGEKWTAAGAELTFIHTPGHTGGSMCIYVSSEKLLFTGDTLFRESCGRCDLPTGDTASLISSVKEKLFCLPDETVCLPGHGDATTIGHERANNWMLLN